VLGYQLHRDDGRAGDFVNLYHTDTIMALSFTDKNVQTGLLYRYKYRARN